MYAADAEAALSRAPVSVDLNFRTPRYNHNAIELHAATCLWEGDHLTIHDASQLVTSTAHTVADIFDMPRDKVRVISPYVGGGLAASACGGNKSWAPRLPRSPVARFGSRYREKVSAGSSAAEPRPSSVWRWAPTPTVR